MKMNDFETPQISGYDWQWVGGTNIIDAAEAIDKAVEFTFYRLHRDLVRYVAERDEVLVEVVYARQPWIFGTHSEEFSVRGLTLPVADLPRLVREIQKLRIHVSNLERDSWVRGEEWKRETSPTRSSPVSS
jgi:hypothetical protein